MNEKSIARTEHRIGYHEGRIDAYENVLDIVEDLNQELYGGRSKALFITLLKERLCCKIQGNKENLELLSKEV